MRHLDFKQRSPDGTGTITDRTDGALFAHALGGNPLDDNWPARAEFGRLIESAEAPKRIVIWSGTAADELFAPDPTSWLSGTAQAFEVFIDDVLPKLEASGVALLIRTHARHVLSDAPRCRAFKAARAGAPVGVLFDIASMFEPSMLGASADHLARLAEAATETAAAVLVANLQESSALGGELIPCAIDEGPLDSAALAHIAETSSIDVVRWQA